jgi:hypothetical protein
MPNQQVIDYIKKMREAGYADDGIKALLLNAGHKEADLQSAFDAVDGKNSIPLPPPIAPGFQPYLQSNVLFPGVEDLLRDAFNIYRSRFWTIISLSFIIPTLISGVLAFIMPAIMALIPSPIISIIIFLVIFIVSIIVLIKSMVALVFSIVTPQPMGISEAFRVSKGSTSSYFWIGLLTSLVIMGGFAMLIVPGLIFIIWFGLSQFVFVMEGHKGLNALLRSKEYVAGNWWRVFWRMLSIVIIFVLISLSINFSIGSISESAAEIVSWLVSSLLSPLWFIYIFSLYKALRAERPELISRPVGGGKGFLVFSAILGPIALIGLPIAFILFLSPSSMLAETRDTQRMNDLNSLRTVIVLLQATTDEKLSCTPGKIYKSTDGTRAVDGTGWLPVDFTKFSAGSPIGMLPLDPSNGPEYFYSYACDSVTSKFELDANLESEKYLNKGAAADDGNNPDVYELGSDLNIIK